MLRIATDQAQTYGDVLYGQLIELGKTNKPKQPLPEGMKVATPSAWEKCWFVGWSKKKRQIPTLWCSLFVFFSRETCV